MVSNLKKKQNNKATTTKTKQKKAQKTKQNMNATSFTKNETMKSSRLSAQDLQDSVSVLCY